MLGCTHYPFLKGVLGYVLGPEVTLVSSDVETAQDVYRTLATEGLLAPAGSAARYAYRATGPDTRAFAALANRFLGPDVQDVGRLVTGVLDLSGLREASSPASSPTPSNPEERP